jgi:hypothetical protein
MTKKSIIMGIVSTYPLYYIKPFFTSLKKTGYAGDTVIFTHNIDSRTRTFLLHHKVKVIEYSNNWPFVSDPNLVKSIPESRDVLSPNSLRYLLYNAYLQAHAAEYFHVMISDVRDVYFQKDPFGFNYPDGVCVFMEDNGTTIGLQKHNRYWIETGFGKEILEEIFNRPISCSGVTIGTSTAMLQYFRNMLSLICSMKNIPGLDQGIHNYLLYKSMIPTAHQFEDDAGPVSTISQFKPLHKIKIKGGKVRGITGEIISIVHQYDRHNQLLLQWNKRYFFQHHINLLKKRFYFLKVFGNKLFRQKV